MSKRIKLYVVEAGSFIDKLEGALISNQSFGIDIVGKALTRNEFFYDKQALSECDAFIITANLPDSPGMELVDFIMRSDALKDKPIIFTVDKQTLQYSVEAEKREVFKVLQKPFRFMDLINIIQSVGITPDLDDPDYDPYDDNSDRTEVGNLEDELFEKIESSSLLDVNDGIEDEIPVSSNPNNGIITFVSPGSTGKSSLVTNVAYALRTVPKDKPSVCIVDLDLILPSISYLFNPDELTDSERDFYDIAADMDFLTEDLMKKALIKHPLSGIYMLNTPPDISSINKLSILKPEEIEKVLRKLKEMFDIVLVDTSSDLMSITTTIPISLSDKVYLVLEPSYLSVVGANKIFFLLEKIEEEIKDDVIKNTYLVLNKETKNKTLDNETVKRYLQNKTFIVRIPEDPNFLSYQNKGRFAVGSDSISSKDLVDLADHIFPTKVKRSKGLNLPTGKSIPKLNLFKRKK